MSTWRVVSSCPKRRLLLPAFPLLTLCLVSEVCRGSNESSERSPAVMRFSFLRLLFWRRTFCFAWNCRSFDGLMEFSCWLFRGEFRVGSLACFLGRWSPKLRNLDSCTNERLWRPLKVAWKLLAVCVRHYTLEENE
jgi:hypothetical protein